MHTGNASLHRLAVTMAALLAFAGAAGCTRFQVTPLTSEAEARVRAERPLRVLVEGALRPLELFTPGLPVVATYQPQQGRALSRFVLRMSDTAPSIVLDDPVLAVEEAFVAAIREAWDDVPLRRAVLPVVRPYPRPPFPDWTGDGQPFLFLRVERWTLYHGMLPFPLPPPYRQGFIAVGALMARAGDRYEVLWEGYCVMNGTEAETAFGLQEEVRVPLTDWLADSGTLLREQFGVVANACGAKLADLLLHAP